MKDIQKENGDIIRVAVTEFKDKKYIDIRNFYVDTSTEEVTYKPTKKGISVPIEFYKKLIEALNSIEKEIN